MTVPSPPLATPTLLVYSIVAAAVLVYLPFMWVAFGRIQLGFQALATPRAMTDKLSPTAQRATWAHQNAFETFSIFAAAALMAYGTGVQSPTAGWAAIAFVVARTFYPLFYIANFVPGRSLMFGLGSLSTAILFVLSVRQVG